MRAEHRLHISATPGRVWDVTVDVESLPDHTPTMTAVEKLEPGPLGVGSTVRIKQPAQRPKTWTVTRFDHQSRFSWAAGSAALRMVANHDLVASPTGTTNTLSVDFEGWLAPLVGRILRRPVTRALARENHAIKAAAERVARPPVVVIR